MSIWGPLKAASGTRLPSSSEASQRMRRFARSELAHQLGPVHVNVLNTEMTVPPFYPLGMVDVVFLQLKTDSVSLEQNRSFDWSQQTPAIDLERIDVLHPKPDGRG